MAMRRASNSACDSFIAPKFPVGCCSALSSTWASVIETRPTVATTSSGACGRVCCAEDGEHPVRSMATAAAPPAAADRWNFSMAIS